MMLKFFILSMLLVCIAAKGVSPEDTTVKVASLTPPENSAKTTQPPNTTTTEHTTATPLEPMTTLTPTTSANYSTSDPKTKTPTPKVFTPAGTAPVENQTTALSAISTVKADGRSDGGSKDQSSSSSAAPSIAVLPTFVVSIFAISFTCLFSF